MIIADEPDWSAFRHFATMRLNGDNNSITIAIDDQALGMLNESVYIWRTPDGRIGRIGSSMGPVAKRILRYTNDINVRLAGRPSSTTEEEAPKWVKLLQGSPMLACVYQPPETATAFGSVRPYLEVERILLRKYRGPLNRSLR